LQLQVKETESLAVGEGDEIAKLMPVFRNLTAQQVKDGLRQSG